MFPLTLRTRFWQQCLKFFAQNPKKLKTFESLQRNFFGRKCLSGHVETYFENTSQKRIFFAQSPNEILNFQIFFKIAHNVALKISFETTTPSYVVNKSTSRTRQALVAKTHPRSHIRMDCKKINKLFILYFEDKNKKDRLELAPPVRPKISVGDLLPLKRRGFFEKKNWHNFSF